MKKVLLLHGYNGIPNIFYWLKEELEKMGLIVIMPILPTQENVRYSIWKDKFNKYKKELDGEIIVIAHSCGNPFIIKYFKEYDLNIRLYISMAGFSNLFTVDWSEDLNKAIKDLLPTEEEILNFKNKVQKKHCIFSDNDHVVPLSILKQHVDNVNGQQLLIPNIGHIGSKSNLKSLPQVIDIINSNQ